jgi:hypothetical protein
MVPYLASLLVEDLDRESFPLPVEFHSLAVFARQFPVWFTHKASVLFEALHHETKCWELAAAVADHLLIFGEPSVAQQSMEIISLYVKCLKSGECGAWKAIL